jgi:hypothetical protein
VHHQSGRLKIFETESMAVLANYGAKSGCNYSAIIFVDGLSGFHKFVYQNHDLLNPFTVFVLIEVRAE